MAKQIIELDLSCRLINKLHGMKINTVSDLVNFPFMDLMEGDYLSRMDKKEIMGDNTISEALIDDAWAQAEASGYYVNPNKPVYEIDEDEYNGNYGQPIS